MPKAVVAAGVQSASKGTGEPVMVLVIVEALVKAPGDWSAPELANVDSVDRARGELVMPRLETFTERSAPLLGRVGAEKGALPTAGPGWKIG
jgi:hypothetical protein